MAKNRRYLLILATSANLSFAAPLATVTVAAGSAGARYQTDATVAAVRQSSIATQVPGQILQLAVRAGDRIKQGQLLVRLDGRAAAQSAVASQAMVGAAKAQLIVAERDLQRQRQLFADGYISQAAMDRAEAQSRAAKAAAASQSAQAGASGAISQYSRLSAPYAGLVASVAATAGDMAEPGRPLLTIYDPTAMKVIASVPQSMVAHLRLDTSAQIELPGMAAGQRRLSARHVAVAPAADPGSHTVEVRLDLAPGAGPLVPGTFARVLFAANGGVAATGYRIPASAVVLRSELTGVYVVAPDGHPWLRQVRLGRTSGTDVDVQAGLFAGERVALNPLSAAQWSAGE